MKHILLMSCLMAPVLAGAETFQAESARLAAQAEQDGRMAVEGREGWLFLANELRHIGAGPFWGESAVEASRASRPDHADPLPVIVDFHRQLEAMGIELLLVPVPPKALVYPDKLVEMDPPGEPLPGVWDDFYAMLREQGVSVLDLREVFAARRGEAESPLYCRQDTHWSVQGCRVAAETIAAALTDRPWLEAIERETFELSEALVELRGDLWLSLPEPRPPREEIPVRRVQRNRQPVPPDRESPVLLLGDSHVLVFHAGGDMHTAGAGLADQLAAEWGFALDVLGVRGSGATPARVSLFRRARADAGYLAGKKAVIWCFSAREFTEATGWSPVPLPAP